MKSPITLLAGIILILGGLALGGAGAFYLVQPQIFEAETEILVSKPGSPRVFDALFVKTEAERIQSPAVLTNVIADLDLNDVWGKKYNRGQRMSDSDVERLLRVDCLPIRNSDAIEVKVRSEDPAEAAALANAIARNYRMHTAQLKLASVSVVMSATKPTRAISPNRPLTILCIVSGVFMAIGGIVCLKESVSAAEA
jgi:capsular polysaccharide biosynthesis protein